MGAAGGSDGNAQGLGDAERALIDAAAAGTPCDLSEVADRSVRAAVLATLLAGEGPVDRDGTRRWPLNRLGLALKGATIEGDVDLREAKIEVPLSFDNCDFSGRLRLDGASTNSVTFVNTTLQGGLEGDGLSVNGSLDFDLNVRSPTYQVRLLHATVSRNLYCLGARFEGRKLPTDPKLESPYAFVADGTTVKGSLQWRRHPKLEIDECERRTEAAGVRLVGVIAGSLADELDQWPERVNLNGFVYGQILGEAAERAVDGRIAWVRKSSPQYGLTWRERAAKWWARFLSSADHSPTSPQPYQQLAKIYRDLGRDVDARAVLRARWYDELREGPSRLRNIPGWLWRWVLHGTVGNGYQPVRILWWLLALVVLGVIAVESARDRGVILPANAAGTGAQLAKPEPTTTTSAPGRASTSRSPTTLSSSGAGSTRASGPTAVSAPTTTLSPPTAQACARHYDCLDSVPYVLDVLTPFDLGEQRNWRVDDTAAIGWRLGLWIGVVLGWALSAIFVASFTSVIRRD